MIKKSFFLILIFESMTLSGMDTQPESLYELSLAAVLNAYEIKMASDIDTHETLKTIPLHQRDALRTRFNKPEAFMARLRRMEEGRPELPKSKLLRLWPDVNEMESIRNFMHERGFADYYDYFYQVTGSRKLSDKEKLDQALLMIPYFQALRTKSQEEKDAFVNELYNIESIYSCPIARLLSVAGFNCGADVNKNYALSLALTHKDLAATEILLSLGANPNQKFLEPPLDLCKDLKTALLLIQHGANVNEQHKRKDLINVRCSCTGESALLSLFLEYIKPNKDNKFGKEWFKIVAFFAENFQESHLSERISLLLAHGCLYDKSEINQGIFVGSEGEKRASLKGQFAQAFEQEKKRSINLARAVRRREITGTHMKGRELRPCYRRLEELELKKEEVVPERAYRMPLTTPRWGDITQIDHQFFIEDFADA